MLVLSGNDCNNDAVVGWASSFNEESTFMVDAVN